MCPMDNGAILYISAMPKIIIEGGVFTAKFTSGSQAVTIAMPLWLVRLSNRQTAELISGQDKAKGG